MTREDYDLIKGDLPAIERACVSNSFADPDGSITNRLQLFCKNNGIPFCRGCRSTFFTTLATVIRFIKEYQKNNVETTKKKVIKKVKKR